MNREKIQVLLVDDNPTDVMIAREGFIAANMLETLHVAEDGMEAMKFLRRREGYACAPRPDLILLDLNMPRKNGHEVLAEIKGDALLKNIPVIILTTSNSPEDICESYDHHANCYIRKPGDFESFAIVVQTIRNFWFSVVTLPREQNT